MKPLAASTHRSNRLVRPMAEINIIPLVDVTLVLLIIFMATTAFVQEEDAKKNPVKPTQRELPLNLPYSAAAVENPQPENIFIISVDKAGKKYLGSEPVSTTALMQRIKDAAAANPNQRVRIDADRDTRFQDVVEVIELCEFEGLHSLGLHTAPDKQ